jgi:hypothetical protein
VFVVVRWLEARCSLGSWADDRKAIGLPGKKTGSLRRGFLLCSMA